MDQDTSSPRQHATDGPGTGADPIRVFLVHNVISWIGLFLVAASILLLLTFLLFSVVSPTANPYVDIIGYLVIPGIFVVGLIVVPAGMFVKYARIRRRSAPGEVAYHLRLDLSEPTHRRALLVFLALSFFVMLPVLGVSSYQGYQYSDSTDFCARACHAVMEPQAVAHEASPHARVACAECHIGSGAGWFVKSKLSGTRQVLAVWTDSFPRPIPPAITELRPARETCEECHWPAKFFGSQLREIVRYSGDEANTRRVLRLLLKTGGGDPTVGRVEGIHMHMALSGRIEYVALDDNLQDVPWVKYIDDDGVERIFRSDGKPGSDPRPQGIVRRIDCMDCHNRAAHYMRPPQESVDLLLESGRIDAELPFIKREAVAALARTYPDSRTAMTDIETALTSFYRVNHPQISASRSDEIRAAVEAVQDVFGRIAFPAMKVDWRTYPDNVGHMNSAGCFRCHDGRHMDDRGRAISSECEVCHTFLNPAEDAPGAVREGRFTHHMRLTLHEHLRCNQCHSGGPLPTCRECHAGGAWLENWKEGFFVPATGP